MVEGEEEIILGDTPVKLMMKLHLLALVMTLMNSLMTMLKLAIIVEEEDDTIEEEVEAWKRGKRLAKRLGIGLYEDRFDAHKAECLMTYIRWAS